MSRRSLHAGWLVGLATLLAAAPGRALDLDDVVRRQKELAPPKLSIAPASLEAKVQQGKTSTIRLEVANAGGRTLNWRVVSLPNWLTPRTHVQDTRGSLGFEKKETLSLSVRAGNLPAETHKGSIVVDAGAAGSVTIPVAMIVTPKPRPRPPERPEPSEVVKPQPDLPETPRPTLEPGKRGRKGEFGVRAGLMLPSSGDSADYDSNVRFGVYYRPKKLNGSKIAYEVALSLGGTEESGAYESRPFTGDLNLLFMLGDGDAKTRGYLLSGLGGMMESVEETGAGNEYTNYAGLLNLGGGMVFGDGRLDARLVFAVLLGSENVGGRASLSLGYSF